MVRFIINEFELESACAALDNHFIKFDLDDGDRILVSEAYADEAREVLDEANVVYDEI